MVVSQNKTKGAIRSLIAGRKYQDLSGELARSGPLKFFDDLSDAEIDYAAKRVVASGISLDDLVAAMTGETEQFVRFCLHFTQEDSGLGNEQEHNPDEPADEGDEDDNEEFVGFSQVLLIECAVYYALLKHQPERLEGVLKKCRMPAAKKYAEWLQGIYAGN